MQYKDAVFRKGHVIREEDIPVLLSVGKDHVYIWENNENMLHENDAAEILRDMCQGTNMHPTEPKEGKIELIADIDGLLMVDVERLRQVNALGEMMIAPRPAGFCVKKGDKLAGTRIIPLVIEKAKMEHAKAVAGDQPLLQLYPLIPKKYGVITTGNEVYKGRIKDAFLPVIKQKLGYYDSEVIRQVILPDEKERIIEEIQKGLSEGVDMIICTGGMSVDPDDVTPTAIKECGGELVTYGSPVLPGAMFLLAYHGDTPILGVPSCAMYSKRTVLDLVLPRVLSDERLTLDDIVEYGHGGLCLDCNVCTFPHCSFGK